MGHLSQADVEKFGGAHVGFSIRLARNVTSCWTARILQTDGYNTDAAITGDVVKTELLQENQMTT